MKIKTMGLAALLALGSAGVWAAGTTTTVTPVATANGNGWSAKVGTKHFAAGPFTDTFELGSFTHAVLAEGVLSSFNLSQNIPSDVDFYWAHLSSGGTSVEFDFRTLVPGYDYGSSAPTVFAAHLPLTLTVHGIAAPRWLPQHGNPAASYGGSINFSMAPVPEPATVTMLLAGLAAVGWLSRRRQG